MQKCLLNVGWLETLEADVADFVLANSLHPRGYLLSLVEVF